MLQLQQAISMIAAATGGESASALTKKGRIRCL
jgi:hypothetical protein